MKFLKINLIVLKNLRIGSSLILLIFLSKINLYSQTRITGQVTDSLNKPILSPFETHLISLQEAESNEQLFVHIDKNVYKAGDTLYFQAYIRNPFTGEFETKSVLLYSLLFNENRTLSDSARFKIENSTASGWLHIPEDAVGGKYRFVAFTSFMQNYDPSEAFLADISVLSRNTKTKDIEVLFNKEYYIPGDTLEALVTIREHDGGVSPNQKFQSSVTLNNSSKQMVQYETNSKGEYSINFVVPDSGITKPVLNITIPGESNGILSKREIPVPLRTLLYDLVLFPEGGNLVDGVLQRVAFVATDINGQPLPIEGLLKDETGKTIDTIRSGKYGPGEFSCIPKPGMYLELTKGGGLQKIWSLPIPTKESISLSVRQSGDDLLTIDIESDRYKGEKVSVIGIMYTNQVLLQELALNKKSRITLNTDNLPSGVCQITIFNPKREPIAERLVYIRKHLKFEIEPLFTDPQNTEILVKVSDEKGNPVEGFFSVAAVDSSLGIDPENFAPDIIYSLNIKSYLRDLLPAQYYHKGLQNLSPEDLDLALRIYGKQIYSWDFEQKPSPVRFLNAYNLLKIRVLNKPTKNKGNSFNLVSLQDPEIWHLEPDQSGNISFPLDSLPRNTRSVMLMPVVSGGNKSVEADLSISVNEEYFINRKFFTRLPSVFINESSIPPDLKELGLGDQTISIPEVVIRGNPVRKYHDEYEERFKYAAVKSASPELLKKSFDLESAIRQLANPLLITNDAIILRGGTSIFGGPVSSLIVLDGVPIFVGGWSYVKTLPMNEISSLTVLMGNQARTFYGLAASGGAIFITTKIHNTPVSKWIPQNPDSKILVPFQLYRSDIDFFRPLDPENNQVISTLYWNAKVYFNANTPATITIPNCKAGEPVKIVINGISTNDLIGSGRLDYIPK